MKRRSLIWSGCFFSLFLLLIILVKTVDVAAIGPAGTSIGLAGINGAVRDAIGTHPSMYWMTTVLGYLAILTAAGFAVFGGFQLISRRSLKKVDRSLLALAGLYAAVAVFYVLFEKVVINYRPVLMEAGQTFPEASFPSSHTMLGCTIFVSAGMVLDRYSRDTSLSTVLRAATIVLAVLTVGGRLASGVHWLTDIIGGVLLSAALLCAFTALLPKGEP